MRYQPKSKRPFPAPWHVEDIAGGFCLLDANGVRVAYVYGDDASREFERLKADDARRIAHDIAKLPDLMKRERRTSHLKLDTCSISCIMAVQADG